MPQFNEIYRDVREVLEYCRAYRGKHADVFSALRSRLSTVDELIDESADQRRTRVGELYADAVNTLLSLADPPNRKTCKRVLDDLGAITGTAIVGVRIYPERRSGEEERSPKDLDAIGADVGAFDLFDGMRPARRLSKKQRMVLDFFRQQLPNGRVGSGSGSGSGSGEA